MDLWFYRNERPSRSVSTGKARAASWTRIRLKQFSLEKIKRKRRRRLDARIQNQPVR